MNNQEILYFIEEMGNFGDKWTIEQVKDVFGDMSLREALLKRKGEISQFVSIIETVINRNK